MKPQMPEGLIETDSKFAQEIGFSSQAGFTKDSYMFGYPANNGLILSLIVCRKKGGFKAMMQKIEQLGIKFRIPTPSDRMIEIALKQGWHFGNTVMDGEPVTIITNEPPVKQEK